MGRSPSQSGRPYDPPRPVVGAPAECRQAGNEAERETHNHCPRDPVAPFASHPRGALAQFDAASGAQAARDNLFFLENPRLSGEVAVLGVPLDLGKDCSGTDASPDVLRSAGLLEAIRGTGLGIADLGSVKCPPRDEAKVGDPRARFLAPIVEVAQEVARQVAAQVAKGGKLVALGGDNAVSLGTLSGASAALKGELGIIWIDAHGDINTSETTMSGNIHGMPLSAMLGLGHPALANIHSPGRKIAPDNLAYIGLKDLDQAEIELIRRYHLSAVTMLDIAEFGLRPAFALVESLAKKVKHVWVCLDVDSMDERDAPGTPMPSRGGLTYRESSSIAKFIGKVCNVAGVDVTEFSPRHDKEGKTARLIVELVTRFLGGESNWYTRYMKDTREARRKESERARVGPCEAVSPSPETIV